VILEPDNAALAAAKILGLTDSHIQGKIREYQTAAKEALEKDDQEVFRHEERQGNGRK